MLGHVLFRALGDSRLGFRFVHTADLHLDSPLRSLAMRDPELAGHIDLATREAFRGIVTRCLEEGVDALMIAGDLTDGTQNSVKTSFFLAKQLKELSDAGIATFIIKGNHDAKANLTRGLDLPERAHLFGGRGGAGRRVERDGSGPPVIVHGVSFASEKAPDSLLPKYGRPTEGAIDIGLMHTSLAGDGGHDTYAPCALADLVSHGFAYWGLGHVHGRAVHHAAGDCAVVMPGMPQGRDIGEAGAKSATLVTIGDDGTVEVDEFATASAEFARCEVRLEPRMGWDEALEETVTALMEAAAATTAPRLVARPVLRGASRDAWRLARDGDLFREELVAMLSPGSDLHLDKIDLCIAGGAAGDMGPGAASAMRELRESMDEIARESDFLDFANERARLVMRRFTGRLRGSRDAVFGAGAEESQDLLRALIEEGTAEVAARLEGAGREMPGSGDAA